MTRVLLYTLCFVLATIIDGQDYCQWYSWSTSDWPDSSTQDFAAVISPSYLYLNDSDFTETGAYYGKTWEEVFYTNSSNYRPLGFKFAELGANNDPTVCLNVTGAMTYAVELMVYTMTPASSICITDMSNDQYMILQQASDVGTCDTQQIYQCFGAYGSSDILQVAVYCRENCPDDSTIDLLWRFRRSSLSFDSSRISSSLNPEMWCPMISGQKNWPSEIEDALPADYVNDEENSYGVSYSGVTQMSTTITMVIAVIATIFACVLII